MDEEGPISNFDINEKKSRLHIDILKNLDDYFLWGIEDFKKNKSFRSRFKKTSYFWTSKFDIFKKNHIKFYQKEINNLKKNGNLYLFHQVFQLIK